MKTGANRYPRKDPRGAAAGWVANTLTPESPPQRKRRPMAKKEATEQTPGDAKTIVMAGKSTKKTFSVKLGKENFGLEEFCNYKSLLMLEILGEMGEKVNLTALVNAFFAMREGEDAEVIGMVMIVKLLPGLLREAPYSLLKLASLALIPNKKLSALYDVPNGISEEIGRIEKLVGFQGEVGLVITIIRNALSYIGLDLLKNAVTGLGGELEGLIPVEEQTPATK